MMGVVLRIAHLLAGAALAVSTLVAANAQATTLFDFVGPTSEIASPGSAFGTFNAGGGAGHIDFTINGYTSLDGQGNCCEDDFTFNLNGTDILSGSWDMGGGGNDVTFFAPAGSVVTPTSFGFFAGGQTVISAPINLISGLNIITFSYNSLPPVGGQGLGDEGWGLQNVVVTGRSAGVPEPATWAMMLVGFGGIGAFLRRRTALLTA
jgi:hypothetical protein